LNWLDWFCEVQNHSQEGNAVEAFIAKHRSDVVSVLSGFDRLVLRGTLRVLAHHLGLMRYL
jgi:hypothetical protein